MTGILPDIPNAPSGWNTDNHYFYEILSSKRKTAYIKLAISSKNITEEFRAICDRINQFYPVKDDKEDWQWRTPFKTTEIHIDDQLDKETIFAGLNSCMDEILAFEVDLAEKMKS